MISITGTPFDPPQSSYTVNAPTPLIYPATASVSTNLIELEEYNDYTVTIVAINAEGSGPVSSSSSLSLLSEGLYNYFSIFSNHLYNIFNILVPVMAPIFDGFSNIDATSFTVNWIPPQEESQNGVITSYVIGITGGPFPYTGPALDLATDGTYPDVSANSLEVTGLEEYNEYTIRIASINSEGTGPHTTGDTQRVNQACEFIRLLHVQALRLRSLRNRGSLTKAWFLRRNVGILTSLYRYLRYNSHIFHLINLKFHQY